MGQHQARDNFFSSYVLLRVKYFVDYEVMPTSPRPRQNEKARRALCAPSGHSTGEWEEVARRELAVVGQEILLSLQRTMTFRAESARSPGRSA
jgi:hypothetical protein